jgi:hemolysin activation/secretion protein
MFVAPDQAPPYHYAATAQVQPASVAHAAAPSSSAAAAVQSEAPPRQELDSHGYHYIIVGNHLLTKVELAQAVKSGATPKDAVAALKKAYERKGYFLVALLGKEQHGEVWLQVIQGRLTHVDGPQHMVAFFDHLKGDDRIKNSDVIRPSILAQAYAATNGQQPQISFKPSPEVGGSTMDISEVPLADSHAVGGSLTAGNYGNRYAGHYLAQAQAWARHDGVTLQLSHSRALTGLDANTRGAYYSATSGSVSAVTPLGTFQLDGSTTTYRLGKAFAPLYPVGKIRTWGLAGTQLLYADEQRRWSLQEGVHRVTNSQTVFGGTYTLQDQKYVVWDASSDFSWRFSGLFSQVASLSASGGLKLGTAGAGGGFTRAPGSPTGHFRLYTGSVVVTQALSHQYSLQFNLSGQASTDTLPSYQQWVLGGINNLSAWLPGTIVGDRGYLGRLTLQGPQWTFGPMRVSANLFSEYGASRYSYIPALAPVWQALDDVGASASIAVPVAHTSLTLTYAKPVGSRDVTEVLRRGQRAHFFAILQVDL